MKAKVLLSIIITVLSLAPCVFAQRAGQNPDSLIKFRTALNQDGFDVNPGIATFADVVEQWCAGKGETALYANKEPYVFVGVPKSPQEPKTLLTEFQLRPDEAIVLIGVTPPPAKYFSYTPYLWSRMYGSDRKEIFATLGDSVNNATVNTIGPTPYNAPVAVIFTPDQGTEARVRAALRKAGYPAAMVNTVIFPAEMLNLGLDANADYLKIVLRNAIWTNDADGASYINNPPLTVFRVTPRTPATDSPFPAPDLRVRGTGQTEMGLTKKLDQLRQGIIAANQGLVATDLNPFPMCNEGYDLIQRAVELCGDSRDAFYVGVGIPEMDPINRITLADGEFLMIYGPNHVANGKATYMNVNVYASETAKLSLGAVDDRKFPNTAKPYLPARDPAADLMYAYKISRHCEGETNCLELSVPTGCSRLSLDSKTLLGVFTRIYVEPATAIGPAMPEMLYDRMLKFSPPLP